MAGTITISTIQDGSRNTIIRAQIAGDADLTNAVLFDASAYLTASTDNKIFSIQAELNGFSATLSFDASTDVQALALPANYPINQCFKKVGGLINNAGSGKTGDILITTSGLASGDTGTIILWVKEKN